MAATGRHYHKRFKFRIEIDGVAYAGFSKAGPLEARITQNSYQPGGSPIAVKTPAGVEFPDITLERGATTDEDLFTWFKDAALQMQQVGSVDPSYERNLDIVQTDRNDDVRMRWTVFKAWPKVFRAGDWDSNAEENVIESVTLALSYWDLIRSLPPLTP